jgi:hypothetical protein
VQHIHPLRVHGFQLDLLDKHLGRLGLDDPRDNEVFLAIARLHRRPLREQELLWAQRVLSRAETGHGRYTPVRRLGSRAMDADVAAEGWRVIAAKVSCRGPASGLLPGSPSLPSGSAWPTPQCSFS